MKSRREQELEIENKRLRKENEELKKTVKIQQKQLKQKDEQLEDLEKSNKIKENRELKRENGILKSDLKKANEVIKEKNNEIANLVARIKKDSTNSSKPSSTDSICTKRVHIVSNRKKGGKNGGQFIHKGHTFSKEDVEKLKGQENVVYELKEIGKKNKKYKSKYVVDLKVLTTITEYRYYEQEDGTYDIPVDMLPEVQYGPISKALMCYLSAEMMAPLNKISSFFKQITNGAFKLSEGTIVNVQKSLDKKLTPVVEEIKNRLIKAEVLHVDETGVRINGKLNWLHTACTNDLVYYEVDEKRGEEAIDNIGILAYFVNILVHDHWKSYYKKEYMTHAECNAHILRYLKGILEIGKQKDIEDLIKLFVKMNEDKKHAVENGSTKFDDSVIEEYYTTYTNILNGWRKDLNGRMKKTKNIEYFKDELNLLNRLEEYKDNHLLFIRNFEVPFDNNLAERSLRMIKTKTKVSGGFKTDGGAKTFAKIRSFFSTCKSQTSNIIESTMNVFEGNEYELA